MANTPDNRFIASTSLEEYFVDKSSGLPLANGAVYFYRDISRTTLKSVYELTGDPNEVGGYNFAALDNPVRLSATGTFQDDDGNNIAVYYFPYDGTPDDSTNTLDLYYVVAVDSAGAMQFTRSAWPSIAEDIAGGEDSHTHENQISNSQFVDVSFTPAGSGTYNYPGAGAYSFQVAPDWELYAVTTGAGAITVTRTAIAGGPPLATNPPYTLTVVPGINLTTLALRQRLPSNPGIWSRTGTSDNGYISGSILLFPGSKVTMAYVPTTGPETSILNKTNMASIPTVFNATVQLPISTNSSLPPIGYASIYLYLPVGSNTTFSSVQVVGLSSNQESVPYVQETVNRQIDHLFHYYNPLLQFKPIKSYLTGWDFPLNPTQFGSSGTIAGSVSGSNYAWDQTIIYSSAATGVSYAANTATKGLRVTATAATRIALVQYVDQVSARALLNNDLSVNVSASTNNPGGVVGTVSLWYTTSPSLPNANITGSNPNQSVVQTLDIGGAVTATFGAGWVEVKRTLLGSIPARFVVGAAAAGTNYYNSPLSGWGADNTGANTATYFAIVVGFGSLPAARYIDFNSISLVPGRIATIPAPQTPSDALRDCQQYYWTTYLDSGTIPGTVTPIGARSFIGVSAWQPAGTLNITGACSFPVTYPTSMRVAPTVTLYSPATLNAINMIAAYENQVTSGGVSVFIRDIASNLWSFTVGRGYLSKYGAFFDVTGPIPRITEYVFDGTIKEIIITCHVIADARSGIV